MSESITAKQAIQRRRQQERRRLWFLLGPGAIWLLLFFILPLIIILGISFLKRGTYGGIEPIVNVNNYVNPVDVNYFIIFRRSIWLAITSMTSSPR